MDLFIFAYVLTLILQFVKSFCNGSLVTNADETNYLVKYGYIPPEDPKHAAYRTKEFYEEAVRNFQKMANIPITGVIDTATKEMMKRPRCGVRDDVGTSDNARRKKRYALHGSKWSKTQLTYKISKYGSKISKKDVDTEVDRAFAIWSDVSPLTFVRYESGSVDIDIRFEKSWHGDNNPFDGQGQTLAHAFFPQYGGDAHFDDDEPWTINVPDGVDFFQVAVHEFGHSLGLAHSNVYSALMAPFYKGYTPDFALGRDDVLAIQALYGSPRYTPKPTTEYAPKPTQPWQVPDINTPEPWTERPTTDDRLTTPTRSPVVNIPHICRHANIDAITRLKNGDTYVFKGNHHYRLTRYGIDRGYPRRISWDFRGVEGPIDAAVTWDNGYTYIFKGDEYWKFENTKRIYGPNKISVGFRGVPDNIDAAVVWSGNGKTYFFKDGYYWRYSGRNVEYGYPRPVSVWRGLPSKITAAFKWENGRTYFFSGDQYYRYNDHLFMVDPTYPRSVATWWLGCPSQGEMTDVRNPYIQNQLELSEKNNKDEQWIVVEDDGIVNNDEPYNSALRKSFCPLSIIATLLTSLYLIRIRS